MSTFELRGKVAVVTGASKGIGRVIAARLAEEGCDCFLLARSEQGLREVASEIEKKNVSVGFCPVDLSSLSGCETAAAEALERFGRVDILVNCAGDTKAGSLLVRSDEDWISGFNLKFHGTVRLTRALWPAIVESKGTVVNVGGAAVYTPGAGFMIGGAVNAALAHFTKALSRQGLIDDVNVNIVHPGMTASDRLQILFAQQAEDEGKSIEEVRRKAIDSAGTRRLGEPEDISNAVAFLCSPKSRHIQGVALAIDGGATTGFH